MSADEITLEQVQELVDFLAGEFIPDGWQIPTPPTLTRQQAFSVVYYLQERLYIVTDHFEMCVVCEQVADTHYGGVFVSDDDFTDSVAEEMGITPDEIEQHAGVFLHDPQCEIEFWLGVIAKRDEPGEVSL